MTLIQILIIILVALILIKTLHDFKKNKINLLAFLLWTILWLIIIIITALPQASILMDRLLGEEGRSIDAVVYFSILLIFFVLFKVVTKLEKIEHNITTIVREIALKKKNDQK